MRSHYETLNVNGTKYEVYIHYETNDPSNDPAKYFDVFDSDGCCINPDAAFHKPPIEQDIAAAIRRLNGSDEPYDYQQTEDAMDDEQCPDCGGEGTPLPEGADYEDYSRCGNCKGWYESTSDAMDALSESMNPVGGE